MNRNEITFLFDVDGIIVSTPHEKAWRDSALEWNLISMSFDFTSFYQKHVAGIPGLKGAEEILDKTGYYKNQKIENQEEKERIAAGFRKTKQKFLGKYIEAGEFKVFEDVVSIIKDAKKDKIPIAAVSSSENAEKMLKKINFLDFFDSITLGAIKHRVSNKESLYTLAFGKLCGKLDIDILPYPIIFEDADKGVRAAKNIGYFCIGIARTGLTTTNSLLEKGADLAYDDSTLSKKGYQGIMQDLSRKIFGIFNF